MNDLLRLESSDISTSLFLSDNDEELKGKDTKWIEARKQKGTQSPRSQPSHREKRPRYYRLMHVSNCGSVIVIDESTTVHTRLLSRLQETYNSIRWIHQDLQVYSIMWLILVSQAFTTFREQHTRGFHINMPSDVRSSSFTPRNAKIPRKRKKTGRENRWKKLPKKPACSVSWVDRRRNSTECAAARTSFCSSR